MNDIIIHELNETFIRIECNHGIAMEMSDHFSFYVPGYKFMQKYKIGMWDGKIRLFNLKTFTIYKGLLHYIKDFAKSREYSINVNSKLEDTTEFSLYECGKFIQALKPKYEPRDYQIKGTVDCIRNNRGLILSPTGSGKSLMIYMLSRYYPMKKLIIVPTISLVLQLANDFEDYSNNQFTSILKITGETDKSWKKEIKENVVISTWQSVAKMPKSFFDQFGVVIGDEAHGYKAASLVGIMEKLSNCKYRFGFTGTLDDTEAHQLVLEGLFGKVYRTTTTKELMDRKELAELTIKLLILKYSDSTKKLLYKAKYHDEMDFIVGNEKRNLFIKNLTYSLKGNTLLLFQYVDKHGKLLYDLFQKEDEKRKIFFVFGGTKGHQRNAIRKIVEEENDAIIIASVGTFSTGVNIKRLHNVIFTSPSKAKIKNLQSIGRGLRMGENKTKCVLFDIADDLQHKKHINYTLQHMAERLKYYNQEKFNYKIYKINLEEKS